MKKYSLPPLVIMIFAVLLLSACQPGSPGVSGEPTPLPAIQAEMDVVVEGRLVPRQDVTLSFDNAGEVVEILAAEGDLVKAGDVIARLGNRESYESALAGARLELASANLEQLNAEIELKNLTRDLPERQTAALQTLTDAREELRLAQQKYNSTFRPAKQVDIDEAKARVTLAEDRLVRVRKDYAPYEKKSEDNIIRAHLLSQLVTAQRDYDNAVLLLNRILGGASDFNASQSEAQLAVAQARVDQAEIDYNRLVNGPDTDEISIAEGRLSAADQRVAAAQAAIAAAESVLKNLDLVSTIDGTLVKLDLIAGERVAVGQIVAHIADFSQWIVETDNLTEYEVVDITVGNRATITPDVLADVSMNAVLENISQIYEDKRGDVTYTAKLVLNETDPRLKWGMTVTVAFDR